MKDIIDMPYPNPEIEADFPAEVNRAAQFAPFAALTGHDAAVAETARLTDIKIELDDYEKEELNRKLLFMRENMDKEYSVTYFIPDERKSGGEYHTKCGVVKKIRELDAELVMEDETVIPAENIICIEGSIFEKID